MTALCTCAILHFCSYSTSLGSEWHLGFYEHKYTPEMRGFETHYGCTSRMLALTCAHRIAPFCHARAPFLVCLLIHCYIPKTTQATKTTLYVHCSRALLNGWIVPTSVSRQRRRCCHWVCLTCTYHSTSRHIFRRVGSVATIRPWICITPPTKRLCQSPTQPASTQPTCSPRRSKASFTSTMSMSRSFSMLRLRPFTALQAAIHPRWVFSQQLNGRNSWSQMLWLALAFSFFARVPQGRFK